MKAEDLTQREFDMLVGMSRQRSYLAAIVVSIMKFPSAEPEVLKMKNAAMVTVLSMLDEIHVKDEISQALCLAMSGHCQEQIEIAELLEQI